MRNKLTNKTKTYPLKDNDPVLVEPLPQFKLSNNSLRILSTVDRRMQEIVRLAITLSSVDFGVSQGLRTHDEQMRLYGKGRTRQAMINAGLNPDYAKPNESRVTWTMNSNHLSGKAVDLVPFVNGNLEWDNSGKLGLWPKIADAMKQSAKQLNYNIAWGGDWVKNLDRPHFELVD